MADYLRTEHEIEGTAEGIVSQNLDTVESEIDRVVHELRGKAEEVADQIVTRAKKSWDQKRPQIEAYMESHPWIVFGALLVVAYLFSETRPIRQRNLSVRP